MMLARYFSSLPPRQILTAVLMLMLARAAVAVDASNNAVDSSTTRLHEINLLSTALIEKAAAGSSPAHQFRIEARIYRELLRQLMLDNRVLPARQQIERHLLLDMVRMSALLHAAADCKTGLVIICPPDLMRRLKSQQTRIDTQLTPDLPHE